MENTKLEMLSTMVTSALAKIIDENSKSDFTEKDVISKCMVLENDSDDVKTQKVDFRINLIGYLLDDFGYDVMEQWKIGNNFWTLFNRELGTTYVKAWLDQADEENKKEIFNYLAENSANRDDVLQYLKNATRDDVMDLLRESDVMSDVCEELEDDIIDDYLSNVSASDVIDRASGSLEDDFRDYFSESLEDDFKDRAIDAIRDM